MRLYGAIVRGSLTVWALILSGVLLNSACTHQPIKEAKTANSSLLNSSAEISPVVENSQKQWPLPTILTTSGERDALMRKGALHHGYLVLESNEPFNGSISQDVLEQASEMGAEFVYVAKKDIIVTASSEHELCDFSKEKEHIKEIILKQRVCSFTKSQTYFHDEFRHYIELWSEAGEEVQKHLNQRLVWIMDHNDTQDLEPLLKSGAQVEVIAKWLIQHSQEDHSQILMKQIPEELLLHWAIESNHMAILDSVLKSNYQVNSSAVTSALVRNNTVIARKLLESGTPFPLMDFLEASCFGETRLVLRYLELGGDPNSLVNESTPLLCAHQFEQDTVARIFEEEGYELNTQVHPYDLLVLQFDDRIVTYAWYAQSFCARVYQSFYVKGQEINKDNATGLLYCATKDDVTNLALQALQLNANVHFAPFQTDPIHFASYHGNILLLEGLLEKGARTNSLDRIRNTPLHNAAISGELKAVQLLCAAGADPWLKNDSGRTALDLARKLRNRELEIWLTVYQRQFDNDAKTTSTNL